MFAAIRLRGSIEISREVKDTLRNLRLKNANNCVLVPESGEFKGMLQKSKDFITWGEISKETLTKLLQKRLRTRNVNEKRIDENKLKELTDFDLFEKFAEALFQGRIKLSDYENLQPVFRLTPPSKGFKSVKEHYPKGDLGYRGKEINELLERMI